MIHHWSKPQENPDPTGKQDTQSSQIFKTTAVTMANLMTRIPTK